MTQSLRHALVTFLALTLLTGFAYPLIVTGVAALAFPESADGSLLRRDGRIVGSRLIGQEFSSSRYFWGRPSATTPQPYNSASSTASNLGPMNPQSREVASSRISALATAGQDLTKPIPGDLVTASGSGLDPDISPASAEYQAARVARARGLPEATVKQLIQEHTAHPFLRLFGESRVNVLELNLALDALR